MITARSTSPTTHLPISHHAACQAIADGLSGEFGLLERLMNDNIGRLFTQDTDLADPLFVVIDHVMDGIKSSDERAQAAAAKSLLVLFTKLDQLIDDKTNDRAEAAWWQQAANQIARDDDANKTAVTLKDVIVLGVGDGVGDDIPMEVRKLHEFMEAHGFKTGREMLAPAPGEQPLEQTTPEIHTDPNAPKPTVQAYVTEIIKSRAQQAMESVGLAA